VEGGYSPAIVACRIDRLGSRPQTAQARQSDVYDPPDAELFEQTRERCGHEDLQRLDDASFGTALRRPARGSWDEGSIDYRRWLASPDREHRRELLKSMSVVQNVR
jgi:hypothetical protein